MIFFPGFAKQRVKVWIITWNEWEITQSGLDFTEIKAGTTEIKKYIHKTRKWPEITVKVTICFTLFFFDKN